MAACVGAGALVCVKCAGVYVGVCGCVGVCVGVCGRVGARLCGRMGVDVGP